MGFLTGGIDYDLIGRLGNHVGRKRKGKNIISMRPAKSNKAPTLLQQNQRTRFGKLTHWLSWFAEFIDIGFNAYDAEMSAMNAAVAYNFKHGALGPAPDFLLDYSKIELSRGRLAGAETPVVEAGTGISVAYTWTANIGSGSFKATDKVTFLVYNPEKDLFSMLIGAAVRSALTYQLELPSEYSGDTIQCWMALVSADGKLVSNSQYVGAAVID